jgi:RNA polymerase sigma-70 factor, ECF subfamily
MRATPGKLPPEVRERLEAEVGAHLDAGELEKAASAAIRGFGPEILGFLYRTTGDDDLGDEVFGDFCEDLWKGIGRFERRSRFSTWAYGLAWHAACRTWRGAWQKRRSPLATDAAHNIAQEVRSLTAAHQRTEAKVWLGKIRETMKPEDLALISLRLDQNLPLEEIAGILDMKHDALRQRWSRLKRKLAELAREIQGPARSQE